MRSIELSPFVVLLLASTAQPQAQTSDPAPGHRIDRVDLSGHRYVRREVRVNAFTDSSQESVALSVAADGELLVGWKSRRQRAGFSAASLQRLTAAGRRKGGELPARVVTAQHQTAPAVAHDGSGQAWVAWEALDAPSELASCWLARVGDETCVPVGSGPRRTITLAGGDRGVLAVWVEVGPDGSTRVRHQRFDEAGKPRGEAALVAPVMSIENEDLPGIARLSDGGYAIVWAATDRNRHPRGLRVRTYDADGRARGSVTAVSSGTPHGSIEPALAAGKDGGFVPAWHDNGGERDRYDVVARFFDGRGRPRGDTFVVARAAGRLSGACVAVSPDGRQVCFGWNESEPDGRTHDVRARLYDAAGRARTEAFTVTSRREGNQELIAAGNRPALAFGPTGQLAVAWTGDGRLGDESGAHVTLLVRDTAPLAGAVADAHPDPVVSSVGPGAKVDLPPTGLLPATAKPHDPPVFTGTTPQDRRPDWVGPLADGGFIGITNTGWTPPDPHAAVGPNHLVGIVNGGIAFFTKSGTRTFFQAISGGSGFWGGQGAGTFVFDPRVLFDPHSGRFIAMAAEHLRTVNPRQGYFVLAISDDDDPNGTWYKYRFDVTQIAGGYFVDYPHVGVDDEAIYITSNNFNNPFTHMIYILDKRPLLEGKAPVPAKVIKPSGAITSSGAMGAQYGSSPGGLIVNTGGSTSIRVHVIQNPLTNPVLRTATLPVASYGNPPRAPQLGSTATISTVDRRIMQITCRDGRIWAAHGIGKGGRALARWYEIDLGNWPTSGSPRIVQTGEIDDGPGVYTFMPSISFDIYGNACLCYARSAASERVSIGRAFRRATDAAGTMPSRVIARTSLNAYTRTRWGDYAAVVLDPRDQATFWYFHEYATSTTRWNTWFGNVRVQAPTFTANKTQLKASVGGAVDFTLDNRPYANRTYVVLAGVTGTTPGFRLPDPPAVVNVDLNFDGFTTAVLASMNTPAFKNFLGKLDGTGRATATFTLPAVPALAGLNLYFAYAQSGTPWDFASETIPLKLVN